MKTHLLLAPALLAGFLPSILPAASYTEAKITRLDKDVKILKENAAPHAAVVGENVTAVTSVATGANSRAELRFPDNSLTRLGANSRLTIRGQGHTIEADKGVLMLEVPEKLRDAKVRTAAVTAAVTGGTIITEVMPGGFLKILVIEGTVDAFMNNKPGEFTTLRAGQMIIVPWNATTFPPPVDFDLKTLLKTSKLLKDGENTPNGNEIKQALQNQQGEIQDGNLVMTNLLIPGLGTQVQLDNNAFLNLLKNISVKNNPGGGAGGGAGGGGGNVVVDASQFNGVIPLILGTTVLNKGSTIRTEPGSSIFTTIAVGSEGNPNSQAPTVTAWNSVTGQPITSEGSRYDGVTPFPYFAFGSTKPVTNPDFQKWLTNNGQWAAFKFQSLLINGNPEFIVPGSVSAGSYAPTPDQTHLANVILASVGNIKLADDTTSFPAAGGGSSDLGAEEELGLDLSWSNLANLALYSQEGSITVDSSFRIDSDHQGVALVAAGPESDLTLGAGIDLHSGDLILSAGRDLFIGGCQIYTGKFSAQAGRDVAITGTQLSAKDQASIIAQRHINVTDSAQLKVLSELTTDAILSLLSLEGDINVTGSSLQAKNIQLEALKGNINLVNATVTADQAFKARTLAPAGILTISGSTINAAELIRLYAEGANGKVLFQGNVTLDSDEVQIAAKTVEVATGGAVTVTQGNAHIFADQHNYVSGALPPTSGGYGTINSSYLQRYPFSHPAKPDFNSKRGDVGYKLGRPD